MPDLGTLKSQLDATEAQLGQYGANLPSEIETQIQSAYTPLLKESLDVTRDQMSDYLGRYFDITSMGPGTQGSSAIDLSPTQKLGVMGRELGTMSGNLQASQRYSDYLGGQMNDMYQKAIGAAQLGQQNLADQYARQFQQYQLAWQEAEAAKDRAASLRAAQIAASAYYNQNKPQPEEEVVQQETRIEVPDEPEKGTVKKVLTGTAGRVTKTTKPTSLVGSIIPNSGGQTFNLGSQYGIPTTNKLTGTSDPLLRKLLGL
jgi:hypothetical protein